MQMLKVVLSVSLLGMLTFQDQQGLKSYKTERYSLNYPADWQVDSSGRNGTEFFIFSPLSNEKDQFRENINLIIQSVSGMTLEAFTELSVGQIKAAGANLTVNELTQGGLRGQKLVYSLTQPTGQLKILQYYWVENGSAFVLTFTAKEEEFDRYKKHAAVIMNSFLIN